MVRKPLDQVQPAAPERPEELLNLDEALGRLEKLDKTKAEMVKLRYFAGLTIPRASTLRPALRFLPAVYSSISGCD